MVISRVVITTVTYNHNRLNHKWSCESQDYLHDGLFLFSLAKLFSILPWSHADNSSRFSYKILFFDRHCDSVISIIWGCGYGALTNHWQLCNNMRLNTYFTVSLQDMTKNNFHLLNDSFIFTLFLFHISISDMYETGVGKGINYADRFRRNFSLLKYDNQMSRKLLQGSIATQIF